MKKKTKTIMAVVVVAVIIVISTFLVLKYVPMGERSKFVGIWLLGGGGAHGYYYTFYADGICSLFGMPGTYEIENGKITIKPRFGLSPITSDYSFSNGGSTLTIGDMVFSKRFGI